MSAPVGSGSGRRRVFARLDRQAVRAHLVDVNDGVIATAGVVEGLLAAGASVTTIVVAALGAMVGGGMALGGMKYSEAADDRDAEIAVLAEERRLHELQPDKELAELAALYEDKGCRLLWPARSRKSSVRRTRCCTTRRSSTASRSTTTHRQPAAPPCSRVRL